MPDGFVPIFKPSGTGHRAGAVPDPGTSPATYVLRADATWGPGYDDASHHQNTVNTLTIATGAASATGSVPFSPTFAAPPVVVVSCDNPELIASVPTVTGTGAVIEIMSAVAVIASETGNVSVHAQYG